MNKIQRHFIFIQMSIEATWINALPPEDLDFLRNFVLVSGSLKELAKRYGISYPTVRLRLDRLIALVESHSGLQKATPIESELRLLTMRGEISRSAAERILGAHKRTLEEPKS